MHVNILEFLAVVPDPAVAANESLTIAGASPLFCDVFGFDQDELTGARLDLLFCERIRDELRRRTEAFVRASAGTRMARIQFETEACRKNGRTFPVELTLGRIRGGEQDWITVIFHDLTYRKAREEAYREAEILFEAVVHAAPLAIYSLDAAGRVSTWNPAAERIFGWTRAEVIGRPLPTVPEDERNDYAALLRRALSGEALSGVEVRRRRKDGSDILISAFTAPLYDSSGNVIGAMTVSEDITEKVQAAKRLETLNRQLLELNQSLEERVRERTAEAERRARELARTNAELEQFAYVASHDLQEPLRMVASYTRLLARRYEGRLDKDADEYIAYAVDGATRMQKLINDLLAYSRLGRKGRPFETVDTEQILGYVIADLKAAIEECGAVITHDPMPTLRGDATQFAQLFQNLIGNALKFRGEESPRIHIAVEARADDWLFSVRDNGIGMEPVYGKRIFEIFQRLHSRQAYPGTGMGLAICKKIVERHGGQIWLESSQPGHGSVFCFTISKHLEGDEDTDTAKAYPATDTRLVDRGQSG